MFVPTDHHPPSLGVLQPTVAAADDLVSAGFTRATLELSWERFEPRRGKVDQRYVRQELDRAVALQDAGYDLVLDLGLQYPPRWVMDLPDARFRDQDDRPWRGKTGDDVPDAVWNAEVRRAQQSYLKALSRALDGVQFAAVRVGGLLYGELRMPPATLGEAQGRLWGFSRAAQAEAPSTWRPGAGSPEEAAAWLQWYCDSLTRYQTWLINTVAGAFPDDQQQVLFPGWGLRPGDLAAAAARRADGTTTAELGDTVSSGLDWVAQVDVVARAVRSGKDIVVYSTWIDAEAAGEGVTGMAPPDYLFELATQESLPIAGENTGGGGERALARAARRVERWDVESLMWMSESDLVAPQATVEPRDVADALGICRGPFCLW